jgi:metallo-beta-lactamase class B
MCSWKREAQVKIFLTPILALFFAVAPGAAQRDAGGDPLGGRFQWESQAPWGIAHRDAIIEAVQLMAMNPTDPAVRIEPFKMFDNVYYLGFKNVSAFLVATSDGLVLLDAGYPTTVDLMLDNVRKLGFKPENIKYILVSHSHTDHYGGAARIKQLTGARIVMSLEDWTSVEQQQEAGRQAGRDAGVALARDMVKGEGDTLKVGATEFKFYLTPGHTVGALSVEFRVSDRGKTYRALSPGGLGMQFGPEGTAPFIKSMDHLVALGPWDVLLANHPFYMLENVQDIRSALERRGSGDGPHPLLQGPAKINDWLGGAAKVARAKLAAETTANPNR